MAAFQSRHNPPLPPGLAEHLAAVPTPGSRAARVAGARRHLVDQSWDTREVAQEIARQLLLLSSRR